MLNRIEKRFDMAGSGVPLVLISGLNVDRVFWSLCQPLLSKHFQVIRVDNRGIGQFADFECPCTTQLMAADVIDILNYLEIPRAHIVGHSLGGAIAQQIAIHFADRVNQLVLCSSVPKFSFLRTMQIQNNIDMMETDIPRDFLIKMVLFYLFSDRYLRQSGMLDLLVAQSKMRPAEESKKSYIYQAQALFGHDVTHQIDRIVARTLVIGGEEDILTQMVHMQAFAEKLFDAQSCFIPEVGHMLPVEQPEVFCQRVVRFLQS